MRPAWVFFDVGEVLMDERPTNGQWARVVTAVLGEQGESVTPEQVLKAQLAAAAGGFSDPKRGAVRLLTGREDELYPLVAAKGWPLLDEPFPDALPTLQALESAGFRLGVIANQRKTEAAVRLEWSGLLDSMEVCVLSGDVGLMKPDPAIFLLALQMAGCRPEEAVMVGDRPDNDIAPAKRLGMRTVRVGRGLHAGYTPRTPDEEADVAIGALAELLGALK
ncbi:MAG TPA: HAD family hydrolase [Symbiobacteriaceae bacterium]|nr:HAD family hydrolase [Symbiobacteriaceae bacterium]